MLRARVIRIEKMSQLLRLLMIVIARWRENTRRHPNVLGSTIFPANVIIECFIDESEG
jgi:hypothetical protein